MDANIDMEVVVTVESKAIFKVDLITNVDICSNAGAEVSSTVGNKVVSNCTELNSTAGTDVALNVVSNEDIEVR